MTPIWGWNLKYGQSFLSGFFAASLVLAVVAYIDSDQAKAFHQQKQMQVLDKLFTVRAKLESELNTRLSLVHGLAALAKSQPNFSAQDFQIFAQDLAEEQPDIRSLQLAPKGVVTYVYPLKGNEAVVGHDLLADPKRSEMALKAIQRRELTVLGPLELKQGGACPDCSPPNLFCLPKGRFGRKSLLGVCDGPY